jgi:hypothetical protein
MTIEDIRVYLSTLCKLDFDDGVLANLATIKDSAKQANDEKLANECWILGRIFKVQRAYVEAFNLLMAKKYEEAWNLYERIEINLSNLNRHIDYSKNEYCLLFIALQTVNFQKLFPYKLFISREMVIGKEKCTICGKEITSPRNACEHIVGNLYMGEMCCREVMEFQLVSMAITDKPFDKYAFIKPEGYEFNYGALEILLERIQSPYGLWKLAIIKEKDEKFDYIGENEKCPCGSNEEYGKCCQNTDREFKLRLRIDICEGEPYPETPIKKIESWKKTTRT